MNKKQVMDIRPNSDGISQAESNEQQRNWSEDFLRKKSNDPMANYDPTRTHLNFEVARSGIVQPIDKSKSIMQKMADNLAARGIKDPNARENVRRRHAGPIYLWWEPRTYERTRLRQPDFEP